MTSERSPRQRLNFNSADTSSPEGPSRKRLNFRGQRPTPETGKSRVRGVEKIRATGGAALSTEVAPAGPAATRRESAKLSPEAYNDGLRSMFERGTFSLDTMIDTAGGIRIFVTTKEGLRLDATERFQPRPDEHGKLQPAVITRRRPEVEGGDIEFGVDKIYESTMGEPDVKLKLVAPSGAKTNVTVAELAQPHPDNPDKYWDLGPRGPLPPPPSPEAS